MRVGRDLFILINIIRFSGERVSNIQVMYRAVSDTFLEIGLLIRYIKKD